MGYSASPLSYSQVQPSNRKRRTQPKPPRPPLTWSLPHCPPAMTSGRLPPGFDLARRRCPPEAPSLTHRYTQTYPQESRTLGTPTWAGDRLPVQREQLLHTLSFSLLQPKAWHSQLGTNRLHADPHSRPHHHEKDSCKPLSRSRKNRTGCRPVCHGKALFSSRWQRFPEGIQAHMEAPKRLEKNASSAWPLHTTPSIAQTPSEHCWDWTVAGGGSSWQVDLSKHASCRQLCPAPPNWGSSALALHLHAPPWGHDL